MKPENFQKAESLLPIRRKIKEIAETVYVADDNHHGTCKPPFESDRLRDAYNHLHKAIECIALELQQL